MKGDLVERLMNRSENGRVFHTDRKLFAEAADAIASLRTQLEAAQADKAEACDRAREEERDRLFVKADNEWGSNHNAREASIWLADNDGMYPRDRARSLSSSVKEE